MRTDFVRKHAAHAAKIRRSKRQSKKNFVVYYKRESLNGTGEIVVYSNYHKYWPDRERKIKNPLFDVFSGRILDLKDGKENAIQYFYDILDRDDLLDFYNEVKQENSCKQMSLFDVM